MPAPLVAAMTPGLEIGVGYKVRLTAYNAATGALVTGVAISNASLFATHLGGPLGDLVPLPRLVPSDGTV